VATMAPIDLSTRMNQPAHWADRLHLLWLHRRMLRRVTATAFFLSLGIAFILPKQYASSTSIMPPEPQGSGAMMLAALASRSGGGGLSSLGGLAGGLLGEHNSTALFIDLLRSGTVTGHLVSRFDLMHVYHKRYSSDAGKRLASATTVTDDKKSGVITIKVQDRDPVRARDLAQGYLDELNRIVTQTSTSAGHQERVFIEQRLQGVKDDLEHAQLELSAFSSKTNTIDIKEQTRAMVDSGARLQAEMLVEQSGLQSLRQIYGDGNIRVRQTEARIASLQGDLSKMTGSDAPLNASNRESPSADDKDELYPPLRQLPRLAVPYADLYRRVRVQETVFELLTQQYEMARLEEARDVPVVRVIDMPGVPEKKTSPHRLLLTLLLTFLSFSTAAFLVLAREHWQHVPEDDARRRLFTEVVGALPLSMRSPANAERGAP
jgi:capsule polysaccharide export protein KpsE/RkpR